MTTAIDVHQSMLEGGSWTPDQLADLMELDEGQHLEFKDGLLIQGQRQKKGKQDIRQAVSAFGNADGGILVVGVTDSPPRRISPCVPPGRRPLATWATDLILDMATYFSPPPRVTVVSTESGDVLLFAVSRAPTLVPCPTAGKLAYYLRVGDQTIRAPEYLLSDLLLGRRQAPSLRLENARISYEHTVPSTGSCSLQFFFDVSNHGLIHVEHLNSGVVTWVSSPNLGPINNHLCNYLEIVEPSAGETYGPFNLLHLAATAYPGDSSAVAPFDHRPFRTESCYLTLSQANVRVAVYLLPRGSNPTWYQVSFKPPAYSPSKMRGNLSSVAFDGPLRGRPTVAWELIRGD